LILILSQIICGRKADIDYCTQNKADACVNMEKARNGLLGINKLINKLPVRFLIKIKLPGIVTIVRA
jgi:hypothetical protein